MFDFASIGCALQTSNFCQSVLVPRIDLKEFSSCLHTFALTILIRSHHFKPSRYSTTHSLCFHQNYHDIASFHATSQPARTCPDESSSVIANFGGRIFLQSPVPPGREHLSRRAFGSRGQSEQCSYTEPANAKKRIDPSGVGSCWHGPSHHTSHHLIFVPFPKGYR